MLSRLQHMVEGFFESSAGLFKRAGLSPNSVTILGSVLTLAAFLFYARGLRFAWEQAGAFSTLLIAGYFDAVDGALARRYHAVSKFGGILDSTLDRLGELLLYSGLAIGNLVDFRLALWALSASFMVSYVRARAEADGIAMKGVGIAERPERLLILIVSTLLQPFYQVSLAWGTLLIAVLASLTLVERIYRVRSGAFHAPPRNSGRGTSNSGRGTECLFWDRNPTNVRGGLPACPDRGVSPVVQS